VAEQEEQLLKWMPAVVEYRQRLASLQGAWDNLALLSHLGDDGTNLSSTREAFETLATHLVTHLGTETHRKTVLACEARAQVAIDILVRNLFERTADVGFLASDDAICKFCRDVPTLRAVIAEGGEEAQGAERTLQMATEAVQRRLAEYVAKYSVYENVVLIAPNGEVLAQLAGGKAPATTRDALIDATLVSSMPYVESFAASDLAPGSRRALIYAHRITHKGDAVAVLCLCFKLEDECAGIFQGLRNESDWSVLALIDDRNQVIASTDPYQVPAGARVPAAMGAHGGVVRFAGREYLAVTREARPYQGYAGPSWRGHVMIPVERAFETQDRTTALQCTPEALADIRRNPAIFSAGLREIPRQADAIQRDLNRSVWNGSVRLSTGSAANVTFAKALLREISNMGRKTKDVFERSIGELHETAVSSVLQDSEFTASLAIELFARNLYERANDCRWWALNGVLSGTLSGREGCDAKAAAAVLRHINSLYTVYSSIVLFDTERRVIAVSREDQEHLVGTQLDEAWAVDTLTLVDSQGYSVSKFGPSQLASGNNTLIYGATVRGSDRRATGGVAVVFDACTQLNAMLVDALPRDEHGNLMSGCAAVLLDRDGNLMCTTDASISASNDTLDAIRKSASTEGAQVRRIGGQYYAAGARLDKGYREYSGIQAHAVVLLPLGTVPEHGAGQRQPLPQCTATRNDHSRQDVREFTTFAASGAWYALPTSCVVEAIDAKAVQSIKTAGPPWAGVVIHGEGAVPVVDLATLLGIPNLEEPSAVILIRLPGRQRPLGILVESLGDNPEVPGDRLLPVSVLEQSTTSLLVEYAIQPVNPQDGLVLVVATERLTAELFGTPAPAAGAPAAAKDDAAQSEQRQVA
jgi:chemotaxis signal transduction protein